VLVDNKIDRWSLEEREEWQKRRNLGSLGMDGRMEDGRWEMEWKGKRSDKVL
jgi:hypothetical protein